MAKYRGKVKTLSNARQMSIQDFGGDVQDAEKKKKKKKAKHKVANTNVLSLIEQWRVQDQVEKAATARKEALKAAILAATRADADVDAAGHRYKTVGNFVVKHEMRKTIKTKPLAELDMEALKEMGISIDSITTEISVLDENKIEALVDEGLLTEEEVQELFLNIKEAVAMKITGVDEDESTT